MSKAASRDRLAELHRRYAEYLHDLLDEAQEVDEDGKPIGMPLDAATLGNIRTFLKDNDVTCDPAGSDDLAALREKLSRNANLKGAGTIVAGAKEDLDQPGGYH